MSNDDWRVSLDIEVQHVLLSQHDEVAELLTTKLSWRRHINIDIESGERDFGVSLDKSTIRI